MPMTNSTNDAEIIAPFRVYLNRFIPENEI